MAFTVAQLTAIEAAIGSGALEVTYENKTVKYFSMDDLIAARNLVRADLIAQGLLTDTRNRVSVATFAKD
jgi:hypothetical protein